jgi:hypothetical protein
MNPQSQTASPEGAKQPRMKPTQVQALVSRHFSFSFLLGEILLRPEW